ncbi:phage tail protein [Rahnella sp. PD4]|uniref:phage tail protein n=1 Tax=Rahnella sp. PD4 TaxID=3368611 RepID=UPI003B9F228A
MTTKYFALLTNQGAAKLANAAALGTKVQITQMGVGDGGGTLPTPTGTQTSLINEKRRALLNALSVDAANSSQIVAEQIIPENEGGFWIREIGLYDSDNTLIAVANCPETYKPMLAEGSGRTQTVRMILIINSTDAVTLKIDPSVVLATRQSVDAAVIEVKAYADNALAKHLAATNPHTQYAPKVSPVLSGTPTAPTAPPASNDLQLANTAFVTAAIAALVGTSPEALDTLNELAAAMGNDPNFSATVLNKLAKKAELAGSATQAFNVAVGGSASSAVNQGQFITGTNGNGVYARLPGGLQICRNSIPTTNGSAVKWTYPLAFNATPQVFSMPVNPSSEQRSAMWTTGISATSVDVFNPNAQGCLVNVLAVGY